MAGVDQLRVGPVGGGPVGRAGARTGAGGAPRRRAGRVSGRRPTWRAGSRRDSRPRPPQLRRSGGRGRRRRARRAAGGAGWARRPGRRRGAAPDLREAARSDGRRGARGGGRCPARGRRVVGGADDAPRSRRTGVARVAARWFRTPSDRPAGSRAPFSVGPTPPRCGASSTAPYSTSARTSSTCSTPRSGPSRALTGRITASPTCGASPSPTPASPVAR